MFTVPLAARASGWLNAWLDGRVSLDAVIDGMTGGCAVVDVEGLDGPEALPLALALGQLRRLGVHRANASLPKPGDLLGLGGPASFNIEALDCGQAVVLHGPGLGLLPSVTGAAVRWRVAEATPPAYLPEVGEADRELRASLVEAAERLSALDVAAWSPAAADALLNLRAPADFDATMSFSSGQAARAFVSGLRGMEIVSLATRDDGGSLSARDAARRLEHLRPLERASRAAVVAACSTVRKG